MYLFLNLTSGKRERNTVNVTFQCSEKKYRKDGAVIFTLLLFGFPSENIHLTSYKIKIKIAYKKNAIYINY